MVNRNPTLPVAPDPFTIIRRATPGLALALLSTILGTNAMLWRLISRRLNAIDDVFAEGAQVGYARGHREGRREGRPVVVPARCPHCDEALSRTATG